MRRRIKSVDKKIIKNIDNSINKGLDIVENSKKNKVETTIAYKDIKIIVIISVFILLLFSIIVFLEYAPLFGISVIKKQTTVIETFLDDNNIYTEYNNELLIYSNKKLKTYNHKGVITWEYKILENTNIEIYTQGRYLVIVNKSNNKITVFNNKRETVEKKINGNINSIYLDNKGNIAVEHSTSGYKKTITVFDINGKDKYSAYINSETIIDVKLVQDATKLIVIQTDTSSLEIGTKISLIDSISSEINEEILKLDNELVYETTVINDDIIFLTNESVKRYNINNKILDEVYSLSKNQVKYIKLSSNYFVSIDTDNLEFIFKCNKFDNTNISKVSLDVFPRKIYNSGILTYIVSENSIKVINKWGIIAKEIDLKLVPRNIVIFGKEKSVALIYSDRIEIIRL